ncbi:MAG TPA: phasin family protein [Xenococcaceae cyanobacterium]|jgi:polyhydroxyalkanoate synthesis regulator phasin
MAGFEDVVKKAFYLGVGFAAYAQEKAGDTLKELRGQAQKLADEMMIRGEMTTEEARKFVDDIVKQAQRDIEESSQEPNNSEVKTPRRIEIISDDEPSEAATSDNVDDLKQQVQSLQEQLRRLKNE